MSLLDNPTAFISLTVFTLSGSLLIGMIVQHIRKKNGRHVLEIYLLPTIRKLPKLQMKKAPPTSSPVVADEAPLVADNKAWHEEQKEQLDSLFTEITEQPPERKVRPRGRKRKTENTQVSSEEPLGGEGESKSVEN